MRRTVLSRGAWLDLRPGWATGSDALFDRLTEVVPWHGERRQMYDRVVDVPRLLSFYGEDEPLPDPLLDAGPRRPAHAHYAAELGEPFVTAGLCLYRDGRDSVAWHGDTIGRSRTEDTMVAILSLGSPAAAAAAPARRRRQTLRHQLGHGDLVVMGGSCQRTWEHAIPKTARPVGPADQRPVPHPRGPRSHPAAGAARARVGHAAARRPSRRGQPRSARLTAETTALSDAVTMLGSIPTPHSTRSPTAHST